MLSISKNKTKLETMIGEMIIANGEIGNGGLGIFLNYYWS